MYGISNRWNEDWPARQYEPRGVCPSFERSGKPVSVSIVARDLLIPVYDWFIEGFDTAHRKEAKLLLHEEF